MEKQYKKKNKDVRNIKILRTDEQEKSYFFDIIMKGVETMSKYNVGAYIRLSRDESYSDFDSLKHDNIMERIDNIFIHEDKSIEINFKEDINSI